MEYRYQFVCCIEQKFPSLNEVISAAKKHWAVYSKMKATYTAKVAEIASYALRRYHFNQLDHVKIDLVFYEPDKGHKRDWDNITSAAKKFILDGLVKAGIIIDDSPKHITEITESVRYSDKGSTHTVYVAVMSDDALMTGKTKSTKGGRK